MNKYLINCIIFVSLMFSNNANSKENIMILKLKDGDVKIQLLPEVAPNHVERIKTLANDGLYDNVVFHRVIDGFMAQTGDVKFGNSSSKDFDLKRAGMGGSDLPDLNAEFNDVPHEKVLSLWQDLETQIVQIHNFLYVLKLLLFWIEIILYLVKSLKDLNM